MKLLSGKVISTKMDKTATILVERTVVHPIYLKRYKRSKKYHVHDDLGVEVGQNVRFAASRPYSKFIKWKIVEVVEDKKKKEAKKK